MIRILHNDALCHLKEMHVLEKKYLEVECKSATSNVTKLGADLAAVNKKSLDKLQSEQLAHLCQCQLNQDKPDHNAKAASNRSTIW